VLGRKVLKLCTREGLIHLECKISIIHAYTNPF
jgi:hypothetical protein